MKCNQCGVENKDGSLFCKNCGAKLNGAAPVSNTDEMKTPVFCPNCGKRFVNGEVFCDECGANLRNGELPRTSGKKKFFKIASVFVGIILVGTVVVFGGKYAWNYFRGDVEKKETKIVYIAGNSLMLSDLKSKKEAIEVTDSLLKSKEIDIPMGINYESLLTKDGKYVYYIEDYDGHDGKLCRASIRKLGKRDAATGIDSKVTNFKVLDNGNCLYEKKGSLYYYNGKKDSVKIASDLLDGVFGTDPECKFVYWGERKSSADGKSYYLQDLAQKGDKIRLTKAADEFYANKDLTRFFILSDGKLEVIDDKGNSKTIDKDVTSIRGLDTAEGRLYYSKEERVEIPYRDFIYDLPATISSYDQYKLDKNFSYTKKSLYYYGNQKSTLICDEVLKFDWFNSGTCMITKCEPIDTIKYEWAEVQNNIGNMQIEDDWEETASWVLYSGDQNIGEYDDFTEVRDFKKNKELNSISFLDRDVETEDGTIYKVALSGNNAGRLETVDDDAYECKLLYLAKEGLYYLKDMDGSEGDLYLNEERLASDVYNMIQIDSSSQFIAVQQEYYDRDSTYSISLLNKGKEKGDVEDVNYAEVAKDGTIVFLQNCSSGEGDLVYYNGKNTKLIDDSATAFFVRRGSKALN